MTPALLLAVALVYQDQTPMYAAPDERSPRQALLYQGDWLEVRGQSRDFLKVYCHRRERPGYVAEWRVKRYRLDEASAQQLLAIVEFLRETPGAEALGIGYAALYLRAARPQLLDSTIFFALGTFADRLARLASFSRARAQQDSMAAHLDVATSYGVRFLSFESKGQTRICYDGEAFRRVLAVAAPAEQQARAALALTYPPCVRPELRPHERRALYEWSLGLLEPIDPAGLPPVLANRLRLRRASLAAQLAYELWRLGERPRAAQRSQQALDAFLRVERSELAASEQPALERAALLVAASRWSREPAAPAPRSLAVRLVPRQPGETCVQLVAASSRAPLAERCTYGIVWESSLRARAQGDQLALAVQQLPGWVEAWVFQRNGSTWQVSVLPPALADPELGYVEVAGWTPEGDLLVAREALVSGKLQRSFQLLRAATLVPKLEASSLERFKTFRRYRSPAWQAHTLALRPRD